MDPLFIWNFGVFFITDFLVWSLIFLKPVIKTLFISFFWDCFLCPLNFFSWGESHAHLPPVLALPTSWLGFKHCRYKRVLRTKTRCSLHFPPFYWITTVLASLFSLPPFFWFSLSRFPFLSSHYLLPPHLSSLLLLPLFPKSLGFVPSSLQPSMVKTSFHDSAKANFRITSCLKGRTMVVIFVSRGLNLAFGASEEGANLWYRYTSDFVYTWSFIYVTKENYLGK